MGCAGMAARCPKVRGCIKMVISSLKYELQRPLCGDKDSLAGAEDNNYIIEQQITHVLKNGMVTRERLEYIEKCSQNRYLE